jgi:bis(5'-nucleosyl)-tetraphosphatase (symmetrical)
MSTYAIGDVQGCYESLMRLLRRFDYSPGRDRLWLVGDLVNRGPRSLEVLRWACDHGPGLEVVLGNHDLQLIGVADGALKLKRRSTLRPILEAPDRARLIGWLRRRPLIHREGDWLMVHAGLLPSWSGEQAEALAREVEPVLAEGPTRALFRALDSDLPERWEPKLRGARRLAFVTAVLTRLRSCRRDGRPCFEFDGPPETSPTDCRPWFELPGRRSRGLTVIAGHWAALGLKRRPGFLGLDSACVWGGVLSAVRLEDGALFQQPLADPSEAEIRNQGPG